tara:strand:- start:4320 stop:5033 length:714 start_codon:yes stop_codon:yes gene_type:complete
MNDYIVIPGDILRNPDLTYLQKLILAKITNLDNDKGCFATNKYFATLLSTSINSVSKTINQLLKLGLIKVEITDNTNRSMTLAKKCRGDVVKVEGGSPKSGGSSVTINIDSNIDNNKSNKSFEIWWKLYDKKIGREKALAFWNKKLNPILTDDIMNHTKKYVKATDKQYRKNPYTYLYNNSWEDEIISTEEEEVFVKPEVELKKLRLYNSRMGTNYKSVEEFRRMTNKGGREDVSNA